MKILNIRNIPTYHLEVKSSENNCGPINQLVHWYQVFLLFSMQEFIRIAKAHNAPSRVSHTQQNHTCIKNINVSSNQQQVAATNLNDH